VIKVKEEKMSFEKRKTTDSFNELSNLTKTFQHYYKEQLLILLFKFSLNQRTHLNQTNILYHNVVGLKDYTWLRNRGDSWGNEAALGNHVSVE
jgi:hypothetical protein